MSVFDILDEMDDLLDNAKAFPLAAHKVVIDGDRLRELVNDIRLNMPKEMKRAHEILAKTKTKCEQTKDATSAYVLQALTETEAKLNILLTDLRKEKSSWEK